MGYWKIEDNTNPNGYDYEVIDNSQLNILWEEFRGYRGSHREFFISHFRNE